VELSTAFVFFLLSLIDADARWHARWRQSVSMSAKRA